MNAKDVINKVSGAKSKNIIRDLNRKKDIIIKNGADEALAEIKNGNCTVKDESLFYSGKVPDIFDIQTMFDDKAKFIDNIQALRAEYDKIDTRRSFENDKAIEELDNYKYITTKNKEKRRNRN